MKKSVIITGATGMVGKAVLLESLDSPNIERVLVINRSSLNMQHPKLREILLQDFTQIADQKAQLAGYDACLYCMGVSALGLNEETYTNITYETTKAFADTLYDLNPDMVFSYVSGKGSDSSETGRMMWARVKGKTENYVLSKGFQDAYAIRLGALIPEKGIASRTGWYNTMYTLTRPLFPLLKKSKNFITTTRFGQAMINLLFYPHEQKHLENRALNKVAEMS